MKNSFKISCTIIICLCLITLFSTCKKYPEDGKRSWHKPEKRIQQKWELKECWLDNVDKTFDTYTFSAHNSCDVNTYTLTCSLYKLQLDFRDYKVNWYGNKKDYPKVEYLITDFQSSSSNISQTCGVPSASTEYSFKDKKRKLQFNNELFLYTTVTGTYTFLNLVNNAWDIKKLTDKELTLETTNIDGQKVRLKFNKL